MELHQLRYVLAVSETKSFSRAAEQLFVVQSNVSAQVRKLELELGVELFERRAHEVVPTEFGRAFLPGLREALEALDQARAAVDAVRGLVSGRASLGVVGTVAGWLLPRVIRRFRALYPGVELWITDEASVVLAGMVASHDLPQALVKLPTHRAELVDAEPLFDEELAAVVPPGHPLRGQPAAPLSAFARDELLLPEVGNPLRDLIVDACLTQGFQPVSRIEFGKKELAYQMALDGVGVGLVPVLTALHDLSAESDRVIRISEPQIIRSVGVIRHRGGTLSPADQAIRVIIQDVIADVAADEAGIRVAVADDAAAAETTLDHPIFHDSPGPWAEVVAIRSARAAATLRRESGAPA